jgi:hypothetical protein
MSFVSGTQASGASTSLSCTTPSGAQVDDILIAFHSNDFGTYSGMSANAAFTLMGGFDGGASGVHSRCYSRVIDGSEASSYSFTNSTSSETVVFMSLYRSVTLVNNTATFGSDPTGNTSWDAPSLSPATSDGDLICYIGYGSDNVSNTFTPPSGMTERGDLSSSVWISCTYATLSSPGTPTGIRTFTSTQSISWATAAASFSIYLPTSGPPPQQSEESRNSNAMNKMTSYIRGML